MGRLRKVSHEDVPIVSSVESDDSLKDPFVPNDFANDASNAMSMDCSGEDAKFDKALYNFYVNNKVKYLKRKISSASRRNVVSLFSLLFCPHLFRGRNDLQICPIVQHSLDTLESSSRVLLMRCVLDIRVLLRIMVWDVFSALSELRFVYEWLLSSIKKFKDATKVASKRSVTFGGCHYAFAVSYLDHLNFGLHSVPDVKPRILAWRGNKVKQFAELDRNNSRSFGKRPLKRLRAPTNLQGSVGKTISSKSVDIGPSDGTFALKVQRSIGPRFGSQAALDVIELVESRNQDKPKIILEWAESLVLDVLDCNKSVSIHSAIANREFVKAVDVLETEVHQESHHLPSPATAIVPPPVPDGGIENPVVISSCSVPDKVHAETVVIPDIPAVRSVLCEVKLKGSTSFPLEPPTGNHPSNSKRGNPDVDSVVVLSDGPPKEKVGVNAFGIPSFVELNHSLDGNSFSGLSPLVHVRLSQLFRNELADVQCSQYVADRFLKTFDSSRSEDCLVMVNVLSSAISKSKKLVSSPTVDLCSLDVFNSSHLGGVKVNEAGVDVHKVGSSRFNAKCQELSRSNDVAYNKLHNFAPPATSHSNPIEVPNSPEVHPMLVKPAVASSHLSEVVGCSIAAPSCQFPGASTVSLSGGRFPRRMVVPGRFNSDPYVPEVNRFSVSPEERRNHLAMIQIASHPEWCKYEAIRYEKAFSHPSVSKKHFFFSYIGETILDGNNPKIVANAFNGANSAFAMWRSNLLFFPLCRFKHWFSFVVCLKERVFAFLDSFYGQYSDFHMEIRDKMVNNFINLWDMFVSPIMRKRIDFKSFGIVYPVVPQQTNAYVDDCGVFSVMYMKDRSPSTPIGNLFSSADIDNIRIKLANELYFSPSNSADKSFVTNFFGAELDKIFSCGVLIKHVDVLSGTSQCYLHQEMHLHPQGLPPKGFLLLVPLRVSTLAMRGTAESAINENDPCSMRSSCDSDSRYSSASVVSFVSPCK
ncbi:hypothetical protein D1007_37560 [Hordeum vulgare]|nr:hypothetical protein D1007_37560 [Hordeum vulgare]